MMTNNLKKNILSLQAHPYHLVGLSPWPLFTAFSFFGLMFDLAMLMGGYCDQIILLLFNVITLIYCGLLWGRDIIAEAIYLGEHTIKVRKGLYQGYLIFIVTELFAFVGVFWAYIHSAISPNIELGEMWPPVDIDTISAIDLPLLNTIILLISSVTITYCHHGVISSDYKASRKGLIATISLAIIFIICQFIEYTNCGYTVSDSVYGSCFYFLTGLHGIHLIGGTFFLVYTYIRLRSGMITNSVDLGLETTIILWHFLDLVWLFVYILCYYWGT